MLDRQEFVTGASGFLVRLADGYFQFFTEHVVSRDSPIGFDWF